MNVFVSETCYRQVFGSAKGSSARRVGDFNRLVARLQAAVTRDDLQVKGLGTKKYRSMGGHDVYGVDLNNGLTAERVIFLFVEPGDTQAAGRFGRYRQPGQAETVLLCYCSEHDSQHRHARKVADSGAAGGMGEVTLALPDAQAAALERVGRPEEPWRAYAPGDLEHYGRPRTPVLTEDKFRIANDFLSRPRPLLVTGAAGSGKTELGLRVMTDFVRSWSGVGAAPRKEPRAPRVLYLTFSPYLLSEVETRCPDDVRPSCTFLTFDTLLRTLAGEPGLRFAGTRSFEAFVAALRARPAMGGADRARMLRLLDARGAGCVYAEAYGVVGGTMGAGWDRVGVGRARGACGAVGGAADGVAPLYPEDAYLTLPDDMCGLTGEEDRTAAWRLAAAYGRWASAAGLASRNAVALRLAELRARDGRGASAVAGARADAVGPFDLVVADEVQDLTEVQLELLRRLCEAAPGRPARLFMTGDVNQVLAPTAFDARRLLRMDADLAVERLQGNFRNPEAVCALGNAVGAVRAASPRLPARRGVEGAPEESFNRSAGRTQWWVGTDEEALLAIADGAANVALVADAATAARLRRERPRAASSVFTPEQVKGMEFDNVILYGLLAADEARFRALFAAGPKDASLHRALNRLYVGVTRSRGSLLLAEPRATELLSRLVGLDERLERAHDLSEVDFDLDATPRGYLEVGRALKEQGAFTAARANLERALTARPDADGVLSPDERAAAARLLEACRILEGHDPEMTPPAELAVLLEGAGLPEEALPYARAALDAPREALLTLAAERRLDGAHFGAAERVAAFEGVLARSGLDAADLYGRGPRTDALLDWYLSQRAEDLELYALETAEHAAGARASLRRAAAVWVGRR